MAYSPDSLATILLTMALSPNREEYVRPYAPQEYYRLLDMIRQRGFRGAGELVGMDIYALMTALQISEQDAYRLYTLLNRSVQVNYGIEGFLNNNVGVMTIDDAEFPRRAEDRLQDRCPPFWFWTGNSALMCEPMIALMGISGVRTQPEVREGIARLCRHACEAGYTILTGGELGVSRVAADIVADEGGRLVEVLGGGLYEHMREQPVKRMLNEDRACVISLEHPEAMYTLPHALARNRVIYALAEAAFVFNTDGKRGDAESVAARLCDWVYAWTGCDANHTLISRGAHPFADARAFPFEEQSSYWRAARSEQISVFDLLNPR